MAQFEFGEPDATYESSNRSQHSSNVHTIRDDIDIEVQNRNSYAFNYKYIVGVIVLLLIIVIFSNSKTSDYKQPKHTIATSPPLIQPEVKINQIKARTQLLLPLKKVKPHDAVNVTSPLKYEKTKRKKSIVKKSKTVPIPISVPVLNFKITSIKKNLTKCKKREPGYRCILSLALDINFTGTENTELRLVVLTPKRKPFIDRTTKLKKILITFNKPDGKEKSLYRKGSYKIKIYNSLQKLIYEDSFKVR